MNAREVIEGIGIKDYRVRVKRKVRTYHLNLVKEYAERKEEASMKGKPVMELAGADVIESEEGEDDGVIDEDQLLDVGQVQSAETYTGVKVSKELSKKQRSEVYKMLPHYRDVFTERTRHCCCVVRPSRVKRAMLSSVGPQMAFESNLCKKLSVTVGE